MVMAWTVIRSSSLARASILLYCLVEVVVKFVVEMVGEMVGEVVVGMLVEIREGGMKFFTLCRLPIGFHQVSEENTFFE